MIAALLTGLQLVASNTSDFDVVMPAMLGVHALIGIGEGLIASGAVAFILSTRPDLIPQSAEQRTIPSSYSAYPGESA
jgi:cobalt/nickel transport system permease protein